MSKIKVFYNIFFLILYQRTGRCKFLPSIDRTSFVKRSASSIGNKFNKAVSEGSANQETIGIAFSKKKIKKG